MIIKVTLEEAAKNLKMTEDEAKDIWMHGVVTDNGFDSVFSSDNKRFMLKSDIKRLRELNNELSDNDYLEEDYTKEQIANMKEEQKNIKSKIYSLEEAFSLIK